MVGRTQPAAAPLSCVLVVDDEPLIRWSLKQHLEQAGYRVLEAGTGRQALERHGDGVDLVVLDLMLPDTDGITVLKSLKNRQPCSRVIVMTAIGTPEAVSEAERCGAVKVVDKPFDFRGMVRLVQEVLAQHAG